MDRLTLAARSLRVGMLLGALVLLALAAPLRAQTKAPHIPKQLTFAGEHIPLERPDVREALDYELCVASNTHSQILAILKRMPRTFGEIEPILKQQGIPDDLKYLCVAESHLDPLARSHAGAVGLWQLLEGTAKEHHLEVNTHIDERYHTAKATVAAADFLIKSFRRFGSWAMAAASYNMGRSALAKAINQQNPTSYHDLWLNRETARYFYRILAFKLILENPEQYGFRIHEEERWLPLKTRTVEVNDSVESLSDFARRYRTNVRQLRWLNPWIRGTAIPARAGKSYRIILLSDNG